MGFQQGLSGLFASSKALDVVGNNIANSGTVGYKNSSAQFSDVYAASLLGGTGASVGIGSKVAGIIQQFSQGNITATNNALDLAISGGGFFQMKTNEGEKAYTRNGQFQLNKDGYIVDPQGLQLMGHLATSGVVDAGDPVSLRLFDPAKSLSGQPQATGQDPINPGVQANVNLDSRLGTPVIQPFAFNKPLSYNQATATTLYDSLGNPHTYQMYFVKTAATNEWDVYATMTNPAGAVPTFVDLAAPSAEAAIAATAATTAAAVPLATGTDVLTAVQAVAPPPPQRLLDAAADSEAMTVAAEAAAATGVDAASALAAVVALAPPAPVTAAKVATLASMVTAATNAAGVPLADAASVLAAVEAAAAPSVLAAVNVGAQTPMTTLIFNASGALTSSPAAITLTDDELGYPGAVNNLVAVPVAFTGSTQYGASFAVNAMSQDGYASGSLAGFNIAKDGVVLASYTNGQTKAVGQVITANFRNPQGLEPLGNNRWGQTSASGVPTTGVPGSSGQYGPVQSSSLEDSNVDLTSELVNMITQQRAYQANAQTIKTVDSILQTLVNLR